MKRTHSIVLLAVVGFVAVACGNNPTASPAAPSRPHFDTGHTFGSGNSVGGPTNPNTTTTTAANPTTVEMTAATDTATRGGHTFGSGN